MNRRRIADICRASCLCLLTLLPFLVPYEAGRNIDMQGLIILIAGGLAWLSIALTGKLEVNKLLALPLLIFIALCVISILINPHLGYDLVGAPLVRIGSLTFLALPGCALVVNSIPASKLLKFLYLEIVAVAAVSFIYSLYKFQTLVRAGGVFAQADVLACIAGCGLLLGLQLYINKPQGRRWILPAQLLLALALALTGTRAVIALVCILIILWLLIRRSWQLGVIGFALILAVIIGFYVSAPVRSTDLNNATSSISYRGDLWSAAFKASKQKPIFGYGSGNLADALDCRKLTAPPLIQTCHKGYFFNSSHNIFLDRVLAVGWPGGLAFLSFVIIALYKGLRSADTSIFSYTALLIALYYLTNVTSASLELLFWVLLLFGINQKFATIQS